MGVANGTMCCMQPVVLSYPRFVYFLNSVHSFLIWMVFSQDVPTIQVWLHSSAEASTSNFQSSEEDEVEIIGTTLVKKINRSPVLHFFKPTDQVSKNGIVLAKCNLCAPPNPATLIGVNNTANLIQHLLRKHKEECIVNVNTGQKVCVFPHTFICFIKHVVVNFICAGDLCFEGHLAIRDGTAISDTNQG